MSAHSSSPKGAPRGSATRTTLPPWRSTGAFTYALTQGLGPKAKEADRNGNGFVEFMELVDYVGKSVNATTKGEQTPWLSRKELFGDLAIAVSKAGGN